MDASSGVVSAQNLDYSVSPTHTITVTAKDRSGAIGALAATVAVTVTVETRKYASKLLMEFDKKKMCFMFLKVLAGPVPISQHQFK